MIHVVNDEAEQERWATKRKQFRSDCGHEPGLVVAACDTAGLASKTSRQAGKQAG